MKNDINPFKDVENLLQEANIETEQYKQKIFDNVKNKIETGKICVEEHDLYMKKNSFKYSKVAVVAAIIAVGSTSLIYGGELLSAVIQQLRVGNTEIIQYQESNDSSYDDNATKALSLEDMQIGFQGKLFDKYGNEVLYGEAQEYYTENGTLITSMFVDETEHGEYDFVISTDTDEIKQTIQTLQETKEIANQAIKFPTYLPEGYTFKEATSEGNGNNIDTKYETMYGDTITISSATNEGRSDVVAILDDTALQEIEVQGVTVVISINAAFWEYNDVSYQLYWNYQYDTSMNIEEVSKIISSMILS